MVVQYLQEVKIYLQQIYLHMHSGYSEILKVSAEKPQQENFSDLLDEQGGRHHLSVNLSQYT